MAWHGNTSNPSIPGGDLVLWSCDPPPLTDSNTIHQRSCIDQEMAKIELIKRLIFWHWNIHTAAEIWSQRWWLFWMKQYCTTLPFTIMILHIHISPSKSMKKNKGVCIENCEKNQSVKYTRTPCLSLLFAWLKILVGEKQHLFYLKDKICLLNWISVWWGYFIF